MVAAQVFDLPLLPYERQLIQVLGISEQEYREFAAEVAHKGRIRPAEYEHIPDVVNDPVTTIIVSLVVGALFTGVAMLMAPKPVAPEEEDPITQKNFGDQNGRTRFNNSVGFDSAPSLAQLGSRIPLIFGRYEQNGVADDDAYNGIYGDVNPTGGILVEPLLVWSRLLSYGTYQVLKAVMVLGNGDISTPPELQGILIGGQPIGNIYKSNYSVFWSSKIDNNRLYLSDLLYGEASKGNNAPGGIFVAPTFGGVAEPGFSMAMSPANTNSAGCYQPIPNGGRISVNWRVISIPELKDQTDDPKGRLKNERKKIAGRRADDQSDGMKGTGRWYSPKCGLVGLNGTKYANPTEIQVNRGDTLQYAIRGEAFTIGNCGFDKKSGVTADDIESRVNGIRAATDAALQIGEIFICNRTLMMVTTRRPEAWNPQSANGAVMNMEYTLTVVDFTGSNRIVGIVGENAVADFVLSEGGDVGEELVDPYARGASWYNLSKCDLGQVRTTRATEVAELGIKSQVWSRANGLCNFNNVPTPDELEEYDDDRVQLQAGTINKYMNRTSFFVLGVKDVKDAKGVESGREVSDTDELFDGFDILDGLTFAIQGNTPTDVYNYIRVQNPAVKEYEYRLIPKPSANIIRFLDVQVPNVWVLSASSSEHIQAVTTTHYGTFQVAFKGHSKPLVSLLELEELEAGDATRINYEMICNVTGMTFNGPAGGFQGGGHTQAWMETILGNLKPHATNPTKVTFGTHRSGVFVVGGDTDGYFTVRMYGYVADGGQAQFDRAGTAKYWQPYRYDVIETVGNVYEGEVFLKTRGTTVGQGTPIQNTWYGSYFGLTSATMSLTANGVTCYEGNPTPGYERNFAWKQQAKEMSPWEELTTSCESGPEHTISYINESMTTPNVAQYYNTTCMGIKLKSLNRLASFQQMQIWLPNGMNVERLIEGGRGPSNNFADTLWYLLSTNGTGLGGEISERLLDRESFTLSAKFMANYWQRFDGAISDQVNLRSWATSLAPLFLCNFVVGNGKFSLVPGVPVDSSGQMIRGPVPIAAYFNDSNILDGSFELQYLPLNERENFRAVMTYRDAEPNSLVELETVMVKWADSDFSILGTIPPKQEDFDMSNFCTRRSHALAAARYLLSLRRRVDHTVRFQTLPTGLSLKPGDYIRLDTAASPYQSLYNVAVREDLSLFTPAEVTDGTYKAFVYRLDASEVVEEEITIVNALVTDPTLAGALLNIPNPIPRRLGVYMVEELSLNEDGIVDVVGSHFPVFDDMSSKIVKDVLDPALFEVLE